MSTPSSMLLVSNTARALGVMGMPGTVTWNVSASSFKALTVKVRVPSELST